MTELKRCPFCGGRAELRGVITYDKFVMCTNCLTSSNSYPSEEAAAEHWNRRVNDDKD